MTLLSSCASRLEPIQRPAEYARQAANTQLWRDLDSVHSSDWHYLLNDGALALDWRLRAIDSASQSIDLQSFLWEFDTVGEALSEHILAAADRGIRTRILIDDSFLYMADANISKIEAHPNIEFRIFNPYKRRSSNVVARELLNLGEFQRLDHRMHNKVMIIDGRIALLGGRNIADQYFGLHASSNFRDMELIVGGPIIGDISNGFDQYWNNDWSFPAETFISANNTDTTTDSTVPPTPSISHIHQEESPQKRSAQWLRLVEQAIPGKAHLLLDKPPLKNPAIPNQAPIQLGSEIITLIESATTDIWIISAYLIPTSPFEKAIEDAENRGVDVHILTNSIRSNNHISAHSAYRKHIRRLLAHGANLYEMRIDAKDRGRYMQEPLDSKTLALHAKVMIVDRDKVFIGSANFDPRSLRINTEMGLIINSETFNQQLRDAIAQDFLPRNAWHLRLIDKDQVEWVSDDRTLKHQPAQSFMQNIEDWFFAHLPIENEM
ncbi:MAG: phospholipase [Cellvibrionales bacterium]|nr:MAG: phospholipase [Cellvibrionales bacterium]